MKQSKKAFLGAVGATAVATAAVTYAVTKELVDLAMDREEPAAARRAGQKVSGTHRPDALDEELRQAAEALANKPHEVVKLLSHDGVVLTGHWFACENAQRVVLAMHGWRSSWCRDFGMVADFLAENHCSVLYVEQRGQNASGGAYMGLGMMERYDCLDWAEWLNQRCGDLPVYLCGISMGATSVLMAAGLDLPPCVHGIISDCGFTSPGAIGKHVANHNLHMLYEMRSGLVDLFCRRKIQMGIDDYSTVDAMRQCKVPVLFIHGSKDHFVPVEMSYENYQACRAPKQLFVVPGADHGMSYYRDKAGYQAAVQQFWANYDSADPAGSCFGGTAGVE